ncbi:hypothetical protein C4D60_Mb07t08910 [Musa balbisiana]|uniref:WRC domain-containing protein n=1 Tax=Musa balbisiana TaxID=52838 RepID=A0A4S8JFV4_MUSBA|nr:hypothetical protein C4D60_Mb07t08910 [Musa balbisiana]
MRIRKRPSSSSSSTCFSFPSLAPLRVSQDPSLQDHPPNSSAGGPVAERLHPVADLPLDPHELGENPNRGRSVVDPSHSDPYPDAKAPSSSASVQVPKEVEEEEEVMVDSSEWWTSVSTGAVASEAAQLGETVSPQKNTRGGDENGNGDGGFEGKLREKEKKVKAKARASSGPASANNNCTSVKDSDKEGCDGGAAVVRAGNGTNVNGKRRRSPAVLMEGSRCSRVNGRGWRCCQQTLVGYSLCEHHLGKGRLRSMSSVRGQLGTSKPKWSIDIRNNSVVPLTSPQKLEEEERKPGKQPVIAFDTGVDNIKEEEEEEEKARTKRKKTGMVKARSISSLLDNTNHPVLSSSPPQAPEVASLPPCHGSEARSVS